MTGKSRRMGRQKVMLLILKEKSPRIFFLLFGVYRYQPDHSRLIE